MSASAKFSNFQNLLPKNEKHKWAQKVCFFFAVSFKICNFPLRAKFPKNQEANWGQLGGTREIPDVTTSFYKTK